MKILVFGNMGYVGPSVVKSLRENYPDAILIGYDTGYFAHCLTNAKELPETVLNQQIFADVRQIDPTVLNDVDCIVYLAAISNDAMGEIDEKLTFDINYRSAVRWAKAAKSQGVKRFIYASSCSVYGFAEDGVRTEDSPLNPLTAYAKSKILSEMELSKLADKNFLVTCFRFSTACGMSDRLRLDLVLNDFVAGAISSGEIKILSDGMPWRPLIHIHDMARAIWWGTQRSADRGGNYLVVNVGSNEWNCRVKDLAHAVSQIIPGVRVHLNPDALPDKRSYQVDFALFRKLAPEALPQVTLEKAILGLKEGLEAMNFQDIHFRNSHLMRLNVLKELIKQGKVQINFPLTEVLDNIPVLDIA